MATTSDSALTTYLGTRSERQHEVVNVLPCNIERHSITKGVRRLRPVHHLRLAAAARARAYRRRNPILQLLKPHRKFFVSHAQDLDLLTQGRVLCLEHIDPCAEQIDAPAESLNAVLIVEDQFAILVALQ